MIHDNPNSTNPDLSKTDFESTFHTKLVTKNVDRSERVKNSDSIWPLKKSRFAMLSKIKCIPLQHTVS